MSNPHPKLSSQHLKKYVLSKKHHLSLRKYIRSYNQDVPSKKQSITKEEVERVESYLARHEFVISKYESPKFNFLTEKAKSLFPGVRGAKIACIDGRESRGIQDGKAFSRWTVAGGIPTLLQRHGKKHLACGRLRSSILSIAESGDELLEFMKMHSSSSAPLEHGCAAIKRIITKKNDGTLPPHPDLVKTGLELLKKIEVVINELFALGRKEFDLPILKKVTVLGVADTDTLGLIFMGNDEKQILSTSEMAKSLFPAFQQKLTEEKGNIYGEIGLFGSNFTNPELIETFEEMNCNIAETLIDYKPFITQVEQYIKNSNLVKLTEKQIRCFFYMVARNLANQYLLGFYRTQGHPNHALSAHEELYGSVSLDGIHIGQIDPGVQVLKSSPATMESSVEEVIIQHAVLHANNPEKPHVIFVTTAVPSINAKESKDLLVYRSTNYTFLSYLLNQPQLLELAHKKHILFVPVLLNESTREIIEIPNQML
ncbi:MAG TPA: hypothetical protein PLS49_03810 [Candidatus Woesebacteria bacterium]|nr:hypothetical protein [Candidatus Woesebacteria bacterium]